MKKYYLVIIVLALLIILGAWWLFSNAFSWANYTNEIADRLSDALDAGKLSAEYEGETHNISSYEVDGLLRVLRRGSSAVKSEQAPPNTYDGLLTVYIGDATLNIYRENKAVDNVVIERIENGRSSYTSLAGYEMFKWMLDATGFTEKDNQQ